MTLLDTGPLVAAIDSTDGWHDWAAPGMRDVRGPVWTCGAVLSETTFLIGSHPPALARLAMLLRNESIQSADEQTPLWDHALALMARYANVPMSFADACLVALAETLPSARIFTLDRDFLIYRHEDGRPLSLLAPFLAAG